MVNLENTIARADQKKLPHALLMSGEYAMEQLPAITELSSALLCHARQVGQKKACGQCKSCQLFQAESHPDYYEVTLETTEERQSKEIKVDQIRRLSEHLALTSQYQGLKIAIIHPADRLNRNAANSLLKTLEEPTEDSLLILVTASAARLPATIRSRCQNLVFGLPSKQTVKAQLQEQFPGQDIDKLFAATNGSLSQAQAVIDNDWLDSRDESFDLIKRLLNKQVDVSDAAKQLSAQELVGPFLTWFASWAADIVKIKMDVSHEHLQNRDYVQQLSKYGQHLSLDKVVDFHADILKARQLLLSSANLQLLIESVLLSWVQLFFVKLKN